MRSRVYFFGCWNEAGHFPYHPGGHRVALGERQRVERQNGCHIDAQLAPRRALNGKLCWAGQGHDQQERQRLDSRTAEYPQGQFLHHTLDSGFTAISWWDRCQGDTRPGCNSTFLMEGTHTAEAMLTGLAEHFPHVLANLRRAGVELIEVRP